MDDSPDNCQLGVDDATGCSTNGDIIGQHDKLDVEHGTLPYSADRDTRTILVIPIQTGLRTVWFLVYKNRMHGCRGTHVRIGGIRDKRLADLLWTWGWSSREAD